MAASPVHRKPCAGSGAATGPKPPHTWPGPGPGSRPARDTSRAPQPPTEPVAPRQLDAGCQAKAALRAPLGRPVRAPASRCRHPARRRRSRPHAMAARPAQPATPAPRRWPSGPRPMLWRRGRRRVSHSCQCSSPEANHCRLDFGTVGGPWALRQCVDKPASGAAARPGVASIRFERSRGPRDTGSICICRGGSLFVDGHCLVFSELPYTGRITTEAGLRSDTRQPPSQGEDLA